MKLEELKKLCDETTIEVKDNDLCITRLLSGHYNQVDVEFIAAARTMMPKLIAIAEAATELVPAQDPKLGDYLVLGWPDLIKALDELDPKWNSNS